MEYRPNWSFRGSDQDREAKKTLGGSRFLMEFHNVSRLGESRSRRVLVECFRGFCAGASEGVLCQPGSGDSIPTRSTAYVNADCVRYLQIETCQSES